VLYTVIFMYRFLVNNKTGVITVADCPTPGSKDCLDFETKQNYHLIYKVRTIVMLYVLWECCMYYGKIVCTRVTLYVLWEYCMYYDTVVCTTVTLYVLW
jgi:hypothetical protein